MYHTRSSQSVLTYLLSMLICSRSFPYSYANRKILNNSERYDCLIQLEQVCEQVSCFIKHNSDDEHGHFSIILFISSFISLHCD